MLLRVSGGGTLLCRVVARMFAFPRWTGVSMLLRVSGSGTLLCRVVASDVRCP